MARFELVTWGDYYGQWTDDAHGEACESDDRQDIIEAACSLIVGSATEFAGERYGIREIVETDTGFVEGSTEEITGLWPLTMARAHRLDEVIVGVYGQQCALAGQQCVDDEMIEPPGNEGGPSDDITVYHGQPADIAEMADVEELAAEASHAATKRHHLNVARTLREAIADERCPACIRSGAYCGACQSTIHCQHREHVTECGDCGSETQCREIVPEVDDDDAWAEIAGEHDDDCEWATTRAHRVEEAEERVMCTGCGEWLPRDAAHYGQVAATYSGTLWYCPKCWELEHGLSGELRDGVESEEAE